MNLLFLWKYQEKNDKIFVSVKDQGIGIPKKN